MQKSSRNSVKVSFSVSLWDPPQLPTNCSQCPTQFVIPSHTNGHQAQCSSTLQSITIFNNTCTVLTAHITKS
jgi:hypothetical protein